MMKLGLLSSIDPSSPRSLLAGLCPPELDTPPPAVFDRAAAHRHERAAPAAGSAAASRCRAAISPVLALRRLRIIILDDSTHVYKLEFVLTPKDAKDATLTPTSFTLNVADHSERRGHDRKEHPARPRAAAHGRQREVRPRMPGGTPRVDIGLKVKAHPQSFDTGSDVLVDVDLEMSTAESGGAIKKVVSHGSVVATPGKSGLVVSLDDDKRHWDLTRDDDEAPLSRAV